MTDNEKRAHDLAMLYMEKHTAQDIYEKSMSDKFINFSCEYADAYQYIYDWLSANLLTDYK